MTRRAALWMAALGLVGSLLGCGGGGGGGSKTIVTGIVRDSAAADAEVQGATVTIGGASATTFTVDNASAEHPVGTFQLEGATVGAFTAVVTAPGKAAQTIAFSPPVSNGTNSGLTLFLNIGQVHGRVLGVDNKPAANAFVVISNDLGSVFAATGADGTFLLENVTDGPATLTASLGPANATKSVTVGNGVLEVGDLQLVEDPNPNPPGQANTIAGTVTNKATGSPLGGANVVLFRNGIQVESAVTDTQGKYGFQRPVGSYSIRVIATGFVDGDSGVFSLTSANTPPNPPLTKDFPLDSR